MDVKVTQTEMCVCGREVIGVGGRCGTCVREGAEMFWMVVRGEMTVTEMTEGMR